MTTRLAIGCMTGTSIDAIDVALVELTGRGLEVRPRFLQGHGVALADLAAPLRRLAEQEPMTAGEIATLSREFSLRHVDAIRTLMSMAGLGTSGRPAPDLVCVHGQTVYHKPPVSWQLLTPAIIAHALGAPVVSDLRAMDLAAGGQGAPITPIADWLFFRDVPGRPAVANLGGFCNATLLGPPGGPHETRGLDVCACNLLLDAIARSLMGVPYDDGGARAASGAIHAEALEDLEGVLIAQHASRRSLGTGDETREWMSRWRAHVPAADLAATACEAIASRIADATRGCERLLLAGGGVKNRALVRTIASCAPCAVEPIDAHGLPAEHREAAEFAVLGALCQDRVPITLPRVTGVSNPAPISGSWVLP